MHTATLSTDAIKCGQHRQFSLQKWARKGIKMLSLWHTSSFSCHFEIYVLYHWGFWERRPNCWSKLNRNLQFIMLQPSVLRLIQIDHLHAVNLWKVIVITVVVVVCLKVLWLKENISNRLLNLRCLLISWNLQMRLCWPVKTGSHLVPVIACTYFSGSNRLSN